MQGKRIGIMGGTFDPIHNGHLILANAAREQFRLDEVRFIPAGHPPHKPGRSGATDKQRIDMLQLAISANPFFSLSLMEMNEECSYTYRTLERLHESEPDNVYYFLMGADSLEEFPTWKRPEYIVTMCKILVATRNGLSAEDFFELLEERNRVYANAFRPLDTPEITISSSFLRERMMQGRSIRYYVPDNVLYYIRKEGVYLPTETTE